MLAWLEERAQKSLGLPPAEARVVLWQGQYKADQDSRPLFNAVGFPPVRSYWNMQIEMEAAPPAPEVPQGIILRSMLVGQEEREIVRTIQDSFKDQWGVAEEPFEQYYTRFISQAGSG